MAITNKKCSRCGETKDLVKFSRQKGGTGGRAAACKDCRSTEGHEWHIKNKLKVSKRKKEWRDANKEIHARRGKKWKTENRDKVKESWRKCAKKRRSTLIGKLNANTSCAIYYSLSSGTKAKQHWETLVGYNVEQLKKHLEKQFTEGMTWDNYGKWEIDHKIPISAFNYETPSDIDFKQCWSLSNLQPLWKFDNRSKWNRLTKPFQPSLTI